MTPAPLPITVRLLDIAGAVAGLLLSLPVWPVVWLAVKCTSRGPLLYRGERLGQGERVFEMLKFRSMAIGQESKGDITVAGDSRVTPVGRFLRATKLDEVPQLLNVLRGDMSLVGPRPEAPGYLDRYPADLREIFRYRPGITSPASLQYRHEEQLLAKSRGDPERFYVEEVLPRKVRMDLEYCRRRTARTDLGILMHTARTVVSFRS